MIPCRASARARGAFTLVELMMVVIVLSVVAALTIPDIKSAANRARLDAGARRVADLCDLGYRSAVGTGRVHALIFEGDRRHYALYAEGRPQGAEDDAAGEASGESTDSGGQAQLTPVDTGGFGKEMPEGVLILSVRMASEALAHDEGRTRILFFPDGTTEFATVILGDELGSRRRIRLNGISGVVKVDEPAPGENMDEEEPGPGMAPQQPPMGQDHAPQPE